MDHALCVFVSSPGDVGEERLIARNVLGRLAERFSQIVNIEPYFWEHEPLVATETFQSSIRPPAETDIVVCILWARIGTRLPPSIRRPDGSAYSSGTEFEFENAIEGHRARGLPDLLVYRKTAEPFVSLKDKSQLLERLRQREALDAFVAKWFYGEDGTLIAAFHPFKEPAGFEELLEIHLRKLIEKRLAAWGLSAEAIQSSPPPSWTAGSPFRGLEVFEFEHAKVFCGRTKAISEVLSALRRQAQENRAFLLILGMSGCGKSSLVRAGVLPMLSQPGVIEGVGLWRRALVRPTASSGDLFDALATALADDAALPELTASGTSVDDLAIMLRANPQGAYFLVRGALSQTAAGLKPAAEAKTQPEARLVLVVDQLEEIFTERRFTPAERQALFTALSALARSGKVWVIATVRSDFYHRCQEIPELTELKAGDGQFDLSPPTPAEMGRIIREPAFAAGLEFDVDPQTGQSLDDILENDAVVLKEGLPLLEFALDELYRHSVQNNAAGTSPPVTAPRLLKFADYQALKGLAGCLAERAEETFERLNEQSQQVFTKVFRKLIVFGPGEEVPTRRIAPLTEFTFDLAMERFVAAFVAARLFTADRDSRQGEPATVRIAHEALLATAKWPRMRAWLSEDRENLQIYARIAVASRRWQDVGRTSDLLLQPGKPLDEGRHLRSANFVLTVDEDAFIDASVRHGEHRRRLRRTAIASLFAATILIFATIATALYFVSTSRDEAIAAKKETEAENVQLERQLGLNFLERADFERTSGHYDRAFELLARAYALIPPTDPLHRGTVNLLAGWDNCTPRNLWSNGPTSAIAFSPDGKTVATGSLDNTARLWDVQTGKPLGEPLRHGAWVNAVAFSPDGRTVATASGDRRVLPQAFDNTARLWDSQTGKPLGEPLRHDHWVNAVVFSPDGRAVATASGDHTARLWDAQTGKPLGEPLQHDLWVNAVVFSPDGKTLATASGDNTARLWDAQTGKPRLEPLRHGDSVKTVIFSPDSRTVATSGDNTARLWDAQTGKPLGELMNSVNAVAFSPDGKTMATASGYSARLRDARTGKPLGEPLLHNGSVNAVVFSPDGRTVATASDDNTARLWDAQSGLPSSEPVRHDGSVHAVVFSPEGKTVATASDDHTARLWNVESIERLGQPLRHKSMVAAVVFSPDGSTVATASDDRTARLWDARTGKPLGEPFLHDRIVVAVSFSPDGRAVATASGTARLWDAKTGKPLGEPMSHGEWVRVVAFSPDGRTLATAGDDNTARLWNTQTGKPLGEPIRHDGSVSTLVFKPHDSTASVVPINVNSGKLNAIVFSPDGRTLATASGDRTARLWDSQTGQPLREPLLHDGSVNAVAFSPDGRTMATASDDNTARLWDAQSGKPWGEPLRHDGSVRAVCFIPDGRTVATASDDNTARLWDARTGKPLGESLRHDRPVSAVVFSPDGWTVATASGFTVRLWDTQTGKPLGKPLQHDEWVRAVAFNPDGRTLATASGDHVQLWKSPKPLPVDPTFVSAWATVTCGLQVNREGLCIRVPDSDLLVAWTTLESIAPEWLAERKAEQRSAIGNWHRQQAADAERSGHSFAAVFHLSRLIARDPSDVDLWRRRGAIWSSKGDFDNAIKDYTEAIRLAPTYATAYNELAWLRATCPDERYRDGGKALADANKACELTSWKDSSLLDTLASAYAQLESFDEAVKWETNAIELATDEREKQGCRGRLELYKSGKPFRASSHAKGETFDLWKSHVESGGGGSLLAAQTKFLRERLGKDGIDPSQFQYNIDPNKLQTLTRAVDETIQSKDWDGAIEAFDNLFDYNNKDWSKASGYDPDAPGGKQALKAVAQFWETVWKQNCSSALEKSASADTEEDRRKWMDAYHMADAALHAAERRIQAYAKDDSAQLSEQPQEAADETLKESHNNNSD